MNASPSTIRFLEELSLHAWPALQPLCLDGWLLRFAAGCTRRANSVQPLSLAVEEGSLIDHIAHCENLYAHTHRQDVVFKMTEAALPRNLDVVLAERGYGREADTSVQPLALPTSALPGLAAGQVTIKLQALEEWPAGYTEIANVTAQRRSVLRQMLNSIMVPTTAFAMLRRNGEIAAVGMAVVERGYIGLFDINTALQRRGQGLGTQLVASLLGWDRDNGATCAYLQVMRNNPAARGLYAKLGFAEAYGYWYRVKSVADLPG